MDEKTYNIIDDCFETLFDLCYNKSKNENGYYDKAQNCMNTLKAFADELNIDSLLDIAHYYIDIFNDRKSAEEIIELAVQKTVERLEKYYSLNKNEIEAYVKVRVRYLIDCMDHNNNEDERYIDEKAINLLAHVFDIAITEHESIDFPAETDFSKLNDFESTCGLESAIIKYLSFYSSDSEMYLTSLERLLALRLKFIGIPAEKITEFILEDAGDEDNYFYDLGMWYIKKKATQTKKKALNIY